MELHQFGAVTQLTFGAKWFPINVYLVEESDGLTLVDAGMPLFAKSIIRTIREKGLPLRRIVLTHAHGDHIGAVADVVAAFPGVDVLMSEREARLFAGDFSLADGESKRKLKGSFPRKPLFALTGLLRDGDTVGAMRVVGVPGHTPGMVAFWHERDGVLVAGDAFQTYGRVAVAGQLVARFPFPAWATWCPETALASARKLMALAPKVLLVGHGAAVLEPVDAMRRAIERR
jgi:glyoxylase-like metal-dependent hydrolase (beta-lactamase superfamily II)